MAKVKCPDKPEAFRLCEYFDLIGGTSTGSIIAALLAQGKRVEEIESLYLRLAKAIFPKTIRTGFRIAKYDKKSIDQQLNEQFGDVELQSPSFLTGFALFTKRMDTGKPWVLSNHPGSRFWDQGGNRFYKVRDIVRASTAAPYFFDPHKFDVQGENGRVVEHGLFVDGAVGGMNNPSLELLTLALHKDYPFQWSAGPEKLFMLSIGTGQWFNQIAIPAYEAKSNVERAYHAMMGIMQDTALLGLKHMQALSVPPGMNGAFRSQINGEIGTMPSFAMTASPLLTFRRLNASLETDQLKPIIHNDFRSEAEFTKAVDEIRMIDSAKKENLDRLYRVGNKAGSFLATENVRITLDACP
ncbi:MAG: Patatin-like phospholipase/acyl hydrolase [Verrucomicrobia bacterium]|nr:MAG: Patatin-like phospholipase/acyl hydrolase [Verrucomicrobiota bacterium]